MSPSFAVKNFLFDPVSLCMRSFPTNTNIPQIPKSIPMVQMVWNLVCWVHLGANGRIPSFVPNGGHLEAMEDKVSNWAVIWYTGFIWDQMKEYEVSAYSEVILQSFGEHQWLEVRFKIGGYFLMKCSKEW